MASKPIDNNNNTLKFLYSYGGMIRPRSPDGKLRYTGGHTRVLALHPPTPFSELKAKLCELGGSSSITIKCPLPDGELDTLVSITNDEDLANIIEEYDRASSSLQKQLKIKVILFPPRKSSPLPSSSSTATLSASGSPNSSAESLPYSAENRFVRRYCSPVPVGYKHGVRNGCWHTRTRHADEGPRFLCRGPHCYNYCH
ncbi:uncharacterized protein LOC113874850 [Abrus precatorius]|uniref:Uncharacterized protein LOC113874850 n=1 Tax=Abrus precatorius TaxID=3816 RepID=A0A8B8MJV6_ABRPR|nr:uncharacterized protein LOC113874850 [Abrus precatorius]